MLVFGLADFIKLLLDRYAIQTPDWKIRKQFDPALQDQERIPEGRCYLGFAPFGGSGIGNTPVCGDRLTGPTRADLVGGGVADRKDEIQARRVRPCEFIPAL